jgi:hypothetical protein
MYVGIQVVLDYVRVFVILPVSWETKRNTPLAAIDRFAPRRRTLVVMYASQHSLPRVGNRIGTSTPP